VSELRLQMMFEQADPIDLEEGMLAYDRYHLVMAKLADKFDVPIARVIAAFVSLSPNSDYYGNLRSTVSCLDGFKLGKPWPDIVVSTYGHCKIRAMNYIAGHRDFLTETKGPKITSFYHNVLNPNDTRWVTVDGHMSCIWSGRNATMKESLISAKVYREIRDATRALAFRNYMRPCQMQAVLWFTRKRLAKVVYDPQLKLFADKSDVWETFVDIDHLTPYLKKEDSNALRKKSAGGKDDAGRDTGGRADEAMVVHSGQLQFRYRPRR
jgi:hypothetical protein